MFVCDRQRTSTFDGVRINVKQCYGQIGYYWTIRFPKFIFDRAGESRHITYPCSYAILRSSGESETTGEMWHRENSIMHAFNIAAYVFLSRLEGQMYVCQWFTHLTIWFPNWSFPVISHLHTWFSRIYKACKSELKVADRSN